MARKKIATFVASSLVTVLAIMLITWLMHGTPQTAQSKPLKVAMDTAFMPFEFKEGNTYMGFDVDLWRAIANELKVKYTIQSMDFSGIIPALQTRNIDAALAGITISNDRKKAIDFSDPYYQSGLSILVRRKNTDINNLQDLAGKTVAVKTGTVAVDFIHEKVPTAKLTLFPNIDNAYLALKASSVDAVVHDIPNVKYYTTRVADPTVKIVESVETGESYGIAFPKGSALVAEVNQALATLKANKQYDAIYAKWFGKK